MRKDKIQKKKTYARKNQRTVNPVATHTSHSFRPEINTEF